MLARPASHPLFAASLALMLACGLGHPRTVHAFLEAEKAIARAQDLCDSNQHREAVAVLADAARNDPTNNRLGTMLYGLVRDFNWPVAETFPIQMPAAVTALDFGPVSHYLLVGTEDGSVRVIDIRKASLTPVAIQHAGPVLGVQIRDDAKAALSVSKKGEARLWEMQTGNSLFQLGTDSDRFVAYAATNDLRWIALGDSTGKVHLYHGGTGELADASLSFPKALAALSFSADGALLAAISQNGTVRLWNATRKAASKVIIQHKAPGIAVAVSPDHRLVLSADAKGTLKITHADTGEPAIPDIDCGAKVISAGFSPCGSMIHAVLDDDTLRFWDTATGNVLDGVIRADDPILLTAWDPVGFRMLTSTGGPEMNLWRVRDGYRVSESMIHASPIQAVAFGSLSQYIAAGCADGTVRIWRQDLGATSVPFPTIRNHHGPVRNIAINPSRTGLVSASDDFSAARWMIQERPVGIFFAHESKVACAALNTENTAVATVCEDATASVFDTTTGARIGSPRKLGAPGRWVDFHPDNRTFVTTAGTRANLWSTDQDTPLGNPIEHPGEGPRDIHMARFSLDGKWIATASQDQTVRIWDTTTRNLVATLTGHQAPVHCARFSEDGTRLVSSSEDGTIMVWHTADWRPIGNPILMPGAVPSVALNLSNAYVIATSTFSQGIRIFEVGSGRQFTRGINLPSEALALDLPAGGGKILAGCLDGSGRIYDSPFTREKIPAWFPDFVQRLINLKVSPSGGFEFQESDIVQLRRYTPQGAKDTTADFSLLTKWLTTGGVWRPAQPKGLLPLAYNIEYAALQRSPEVLLEMYESAPADPFILAALSLFEPDRAVALHLARFALKKADQRPLAKAYIAGTFLKYDLKSEADALMQQALAEAPGNVSVILRAARLYVVLQRKEQALALFEEALKLEPKDPEALRSYGWSLYKLGDNAKALEKFRQGHDLAGRADPDLATGVCLSSIATGDQAGAVSEYRRLILLSQDWADAAYIAELPGWSDKERTEMEHLRTLATANP